jgi:D-glycero-D-manno-heptose 1,7-bisphosphate phosphatase
MDAVRRVNTRMQEMLAEEGAAVDAIYVCPHAPDAGCGCRKPAAGLVQDAAKKHGFALSDLFIIGDNVCDVELGKKAGAVTILVRTGYGARVEAEGSCDPDYIVDDLPGAALVIERILRINAPVGEEVMGS